jgi:hypothetical protein
MSVLLFLLIPALAVALGSSVLAMRQRKPTDMNSSIQSFKREMQALSPENDPNRRG